jgi:hypothetical protein
MHCDHRIWGLQKWYFEKPYDYMQIPEEIRKCVAFLGYPMADGSERLRGTAFFVSRDIGGRTFTYAVTAKHVIDKIKNLGINEVILKLNRTGGAALANRVPLANWHFHPSDKSVDVAVLRVVLPDALDYRTFPIIGAATSDVIKAHNIGIGEEVFLTGLFSPHVETERNVPIVRAGVIAAMPEERISTKIGKIDAYLIEARSIGGLSGSPVFVYLPEARGGRLTRGPIYFLLGIVHGHFDSEELKKDVIEDAFPEETINMGIAIVVPIEKVIEVLDQPKLRDEDGKIAESIRKRNLPTMD